MYIIYWSIVMQEELHKEYAKQLSKSIELSNRL